MDVTNTPTKHHFFLEKKGYKKDVLKLTMMAIKRKIINSLNVISELVGIRIEK